MQALSGLCVLPSIEKGHKCEQWNIHRIRQNRKAGCPAGVPNDLYELPQLEGNYHKYIPVHINIQLPHSFNQSLKIVKCHIHTTSMLQLLVLSELWLT